MLLNKLGVNFFLLFFLSTLKGSFIFEDLLMTNPNEEPYNKFHRPDFNESAVRVCVFIHLESMRDISSETTLDFYLIQFWSDARVIPKTPPLKITGGNLPDSIWYPDTYFQLVRSQIYSLEEQYLVADESGNIEYNRKVRLTTPCSPDVMLFPFDIVTCSLMLSSFGYTANEVYYTWLRGSDSQSNVSGEGDSQSTEELTTGGVHIDEKNNNVDHLGFYLQGAYTTHHKVAYGGYNYSTLKTVFLLQRKYSAYLMQVYLPAGLIVMLSWTIFWINVAATPARASLGVTTVLTMLTLATQSTAQNEKHVNRKLTAIDLYLWACFLFVIFAMLEFALSDYTTFRNNATAAAAAASARNNNINGRSHLPTRNMIDNTQYVPTKQQILTAKPPPLKQDYVNSHSLQIEKNEMLNGQQRRETNQFLIHNPNQHLKLHVPVPPQNRSRLTPRGQTQKRKSSGISFLESRMMSLHKVNEWARWAFPLSFFAFNLVYWTILLYMACTRQYP